MTIIERVYASGGDVIIPTIELICAAWAEPILICNGFENQSVIDEDGRALTFLAAGIDVALPEKSNRGSQALTFAIDNVTGEAQQQIDAALEAQERVTLMYRTYLASDLSAPAERPLRMSVLGGSIVGTQIQIQAGFFDLINVAWPRDLYTTKFAPALKYL